MSMTDTVPSFAPNGAGAIPFGHRLVPPGDPLAGAAFDAIYAQQIEPELVRLEAERRRAMIAFVLALAAGGVLVLLEYLLAPSLFPQANGLAIRIDLPIVIFAGVIGYLPLAAVGRRAKAAIAQALCAPLGLTYATSGQVPDDFGTYLVLGLLPRPEEKTFEDFFCGRRGQADFMLCEATLTRGSGKSRQTVFHGMIIRVTGRRERASRTVVLRDTGWLDRFECPPGLKKVGLEDPKFEKIFEAFGSDQVEAREILTPTFMEQLETLESEVTGKRLRCGFIGADVLVAIEGADRFEVGSLFTSLVDRRRVEGIARDLEQVLVLIDRIEAA